MGEVNYARIKIQSEAKRIRQLIKGGGIYGERVDMDDPDMVIVATYLYGSSMATRIHAEEFKKFSDWLNGQAT